LPALTSSVLHFSLVHAGSRPDGTAEASLRAPQRQAVRSAGDAAHRSTAASSSRPAVNHL
jgi:hypothetical protein